MYFSRSSCLLQISEEFCLNLDFFSILLILIYRTKGGKKFYSEICLIKIYHIFSWNFWFKSLFESVFKIKKQDPHSSQSTF